jgi:hypothetical protein
MQKCKQVDPPKPQTLPNSTVLWFQTARCRERFFKYPELSCSLSLHLLQIGGTHLKDLAGLFHFAGCGSGNHQLLLPSSRSPVSERCCMRRENQKKRQQKTPSSTIVVVPVFEILSS